MASKQRKIWKIAIRKKESTDEIFLENGEAKFSTIEIPNRYWAADPFLFVHNGVEYLFYELFDHVIGRGAIAYSIISERGVSSPKVVIKKTYHLSFPYVFEYGGDIYIMPESCEDQTIRLFRACSFPNKWVEDQILIKDISACDTIFLEENNKKFLLTSKMVDGDYCCVENILYKIKDNKIDEKTCSMVACGDFGVRNAGKVLIRNGKLLRVGQNCQKHQYGKGMVLWEILSIYPFQERIIREISTADLSKHLKKKELLFGIHTYNSDDKYEVIDFLTETKISFYIRFFALLHRCYSFFLRKVRCVFYGYFAKCKNL